MKEVGRAPKTFFNAIMKGVLKREDLPYQEWWTWVEMNNHPISKIDSGHDGALAISQILYYAEQYAKNRAVVHLRWNEPFKTPITSSDTLRPLYPEEPEYPTDTFMYIEDRTHNKIYVAEIGIIHAGLPTKYNPDTLPGRVNYMVHNPGIHWMRNHGFYLATDTSLISKDYGQLATTFLKAILDTGKAPWRMGNLRGTARVDSAIRQHSIKPEYGLLKDPQAVISSLEDIWAQWVNNEFLPEGIPTDSIRKVNIAIMIMIIKSAREFKMHARFLKRNSLPAQHYKGYFFYITRSQIRTCTLDSTNLPITRPDPREEVSF